MDQAAVTIPVEFAEIRHPKIDEITSLPKPRYKGHWALVTKDGAASELFYQTMTGSVLMARPQPTSAALSWDHEHHRHFIADITPIMAGMGIENPPEVPAPGSRLGEALCGYRYGTPKAVANLVRRMADIGHTTLKLVDKGSMVSAVYSDPDGLKVDCFAAVEGGASKAEVELDQNAFIERFG